jgi:uncharacterized Ntn-hydrolase superfamily protein
MSIAARRVLMTASLLGLCVPASASATWSIIVLDRDSGLVGAAAASCTSDVHGILGLVPGTGAVLAQAIGHPPALGEALRLLREDVSPDSVLRFITHSSVDSATHERQYAIATLSGAQVQFTGSATMGYRGERSALGVLVQGSLLVGPEVLDRTMFAIMKARAAGKPMEEVLMEALKAGADAGGDSRCGEQRATTAFLTVARPGDIANWPYLTLRVVGVEQGTPVNAVELLHARLVHWQAAEGPKYSITSETVRPGSATREER